jgi:aromatic-L-amino-acid decarboxylase
MINQEQSANTIPLTDNNHSLLDSIKACRELANRLEPVGQERDAITHEVVRYTDAFLDSITTRKAYDTRTDNAKLLAQEAFSYEGAPIEEILHLLDIAVDNTGLNPASGGHLGYIPGGGIYTAALGDLLAAVTNRYAGIRYGSPGAVEMERVLIRWMCSLFGYPSGAGGTLCSGGSIANLVAIVSARDKHQIQGAKSEQAVVYMTDQTHHCIHKALRIAGLGTCTIRNITRDKNDRMDTIHLSRQIAEDRDAGLIPWLIVGSIGTTDTGSVDDIASLGEISREEKCWLHLDAAYGGFFVLLDELKAKFKGVELADSIVIDPHKGLFLPYGLGAVLVREEVDMLHSHYYLANYMQDAYTGSMDYSPADVSPELTRHFRALRLWLPLKLHGIGPFESCLREKYLLAQYASKALTQIEGIYLRTDPELSVVCFGLQIEDSELREKQTAQLIEYIKSNGEVFLSSTRIDDQWYIRMAILSFRTTIDTIDSAIKQIQSGIRAISK